MRVNAPLMAILGTAAGSVAAVALYQVGSSVTATSALEDPHRTASATGTWLPCDPGSTLRHGTCVTVRHRVVTVAVPAAVDSASESPRATAISDRHAAPTHVSSAAEGHEHSGHGDDATDDAADDDDAAEADDDATDDSDQARDDDSGHESEEDGHGGGHDD